MKMKMPRVCSHPKPKQKLTTVRNKGTKEEETVIHQCKVQNAIGKEEYVVHVVICKKAISEA
jgi:hypothetical protein